MSENRHQAGFCILMNASHLDYLQNLVSGILVLKEKLNHCFQHWEPESPPLTVIFGEVGEAIGENFAELPNEVKMAIFKMIEEGMLSPDSDLRTAVATGLIEALVGSSDGKPEMWDEFSELLGDTSLKHATWWRSFGH